MEFDLEEFEEIEKLGLDGREKEIAVEAFKMGMDAYEEIAEDKLMEILTWTFVEIEPTTTLEKASYYSCLETLWV